jgi:chemotaxis protein methyltransferase CheR
MNPSIKLKELIKSKTHNILTDKKIEEITKLIKSKNPMATIEESLTKLEMYSELPSWLNDALTINETFFFRHPNHFKELECYLDRLREKKDQIKILCGGVSTGEEAYSVGMVAQKYFKNRFRVDGVDLSKAAIETAEKGLYTQVSIERVPEEFRDLFNMNTKKIETLGNHKLEISNDLKSHVHFKVSNIFKSGLEYYDVIFLRNILIYFEHEDKKKLVERMMARLEKGGLFVIGAGEVIPAEIKLPLKLIAPSIGIKG